MLSSDHAIAAIENNLHGLFARFGMWKGAEVDDREERLSLLTTVPVPVFNSVLRARLPSRTVERAIDDEIRVRRQRNVPLLWWTGPSTAPDDLGDRLLARGFAGGTIPGMAIDLERALNAPRPVDGLVVERVADSAGMMRWCKTVVRGFGFPPESLAPFHQFGCAQGFDDDAPYRSYIGRLGRKVVATSSVFVDASGETGVAGVYSVSVLPEARKLGIGAHMTHAALAAGRDAGCGIGILHSSSLGFGVYRKLGFAEYCRIGQYVWTPGAAVAR